MYLCLGMRCPTCNIPAYPGVSPPRTVEAWHLQEAGDVGLREGREREVERTRRLQAARRHVPHARHLESDAGLAGRRGVIRGDVEGQSGHGDRRRREARRSGRRGFIVLVRLLVRRSDLGHLKHSEGRGRPAGVKMLKSTGEGGGVGGAPPEAL